MPTIKVPEIKIPKVDVPKTPFINEHVLTGIIPGCNLFHRDLEITKNPSILFNDRKAFVTCPEGEMPSFEPVITKGTATAPEQSFRSITYDPQESIETEGSYNYKSKASSNNAFFQPKNEKEKEPELPPCPDLSRVLPVGSFTSDLRTSRIKEYIRAENGYDCVPILEEVTFIKSVLPTPAAALNVVSISLLAASSPLLIPVIKAASKTFFKKVISRFQKSKNDDEVKPD